MIVKVCGMRDGANISDVVALGVDMIGFILYPPSPRYVGDSEPVSTTGVDRVGVFVDEDISDILKLSRRYSLTYVQLHGSESVEQCRTIREAGYGVIKTISVSCVDDFKVAEIYEGEVDMLLFDTKCDGYGGSGKSFNWDMLNCYDGTTPFLLSGGVNEGDEVEIKEIKHRMFLGVDLNSRFEFNPALKDIYKLDNFIKNIR